MCDHVRKPLVAAGLDAFQRNIAANSATPLAALSVSAFCNFPAGTLVPQQVSTEESTLDEEGHCCRRLDRRSGLSRRETQIVHVGHAPPCPLRISGISVGLPHQVISLPRVFAIPNRGIAKPPSDWPRAETRGLNSGTSCRSGTSTGFVRSRECGIIRPPHSFPNRFPLWNGQNRDSATLADSLYTAMTSHQERRLQRLIRVDTRDRANLEVIHTDDIFGPRGITLDQTRRNQELSPLCFGWWCSRSDGDLTFQAPRCPSRGSSTIKLHHHLR